MYARERHHRRSIRWAGYDYAQAGAYFVTVCVQERGCLFGDVVESEMRLNDAGCMVRAAWDEMADHYPGVQTDAFVVMPNHVHAIIVLGGPTAGAAVGAGPCACPNAGQSYGETAQPPAGTGQPLSQIGQPQGVAPTGAGRSCGETGQPQGVACTLSLGDVVHRFKTLTTKRYADGVKQHGWPAFTGRLWQRNYYEHVIRDERSLNRIRQYITDNPASWMLDRENPQAKPDGR
jgi:putative transposase